MRLATRCTACGTTFRVVPDQLRVSDGWVRCGRCDTVFDAWDSLAEMEGDGSGATQYAGLAGLADRPPAAQPPVETPVPEAGPAQEEQATGPQPEPEPQPEPVPDTDEAPRHDAPAPDPGVDIYATLLVSDESGVPEEWLTHPPSVVDTEGSGALDSTVAHASVEVIEAAPEPTPVPAFEPASGPALMDEDPGRDTDDESGLHLLDLQEPAFEAPVPIDAPDSVPPPPPGFVISDYAQDPVLEVEHAAPLHPETATVVEVRDDELHTLAAGADGEPSLPPVSPHATEPQRDERHAWDDVEDANDLLPRWNIPDDPSEIVAPTTSGGALATVPGFVLDADRRARWQHPAVRAVLALVALALLATLALQAAIQWRDDLVADHPDLRAGLEQVCRYAGCTLSAPRRIDELVVDSSGLAKVAGAGSDEAYRLSLVLRSRSSVDVAMPAFELTLSDAQGTVVSRRVLKAAELDVPRTTVPSGAELPMHATLTTPGHAVVGYTVEIFYP